MTMSEEQFQRVVRACHWAIFGGLVVFIAGIVVWIGHLIGTAWHLKDVPSASIGISIVAIPVFLTLLGVIVSVFWGILVDPEAR